VPLPHASGCAVLLPFLVAYSLGDSDLHPAIAQYGMVLAARTTIAPLPARSPANYEAKPG